MKRLPPYARPLAERQKFTNLPFLVIVCIGQDCWNRAKKWNQCPNDICALTLPDGQLSEGYVWPVAHCQIVVEWNTGPSEPQIIQLVETLFRYAAESVTVHPLITNIEQPIWEYDLEKPVGKRWQQTRETMRTYYPSEVTANVA